MNHLPDVLLNPNTKRVWSKKRQAYRTMHWTDKATAFRDAKTEIGWLALEAMANQNWPREERPLEFAKISYEFYQKDKRHRDKDNLCAACKFVPDSLVGVGVIFMDDGKHLSFGEPKLIFSDEDKTVILVEEIDNG